MKKNFNNFDDACDFCFDNGMDPGTHVFTSKNGFVVKF